jgi:hypothetical protein
MTNDSQLVPYGSWENILDSAYSSQNLEEFLRFHFSNGLEGFSIDESELEEQRNKLEILRKKDQKDYEDTLARARQEFNKSHGLLQRLFRMVRYVPPDFEPSLETTVFERLVEIGETLTEYVANLQQFSSHFITAVREYQRLCQEENKLESEREQIERRQREYTEEKRLMLDLLNQLEDYSILDDEARAKLVEAIKEKARNVDIRYEEVRKSFLRRLKEGLFVLEQTREQDEANYKLAAVQLDSVSRQIDTLKKNVARLWELYHPARIEAARLEAVYRELRSATQIGMAIYNVSKVLLEAEELCREAREKQEALEAEIEARIEILKFYRELNGGESCYQLSDGEAKLK